MEKMSENPDPRIKRIAEMLKESGRSVRWLAGELETAHSNLNSWLSGEKSPRDPSILDRAINTLYGELASRVTENYGLPSEANKILDVGSLRTVPVFFGGPPSNVEEPGTPIRIEYFPYHSYTNLYGIFIKSNHFDPVLKAGDIAVFDAIAGEYGTLWVHGNRRGPRIGFVYTVDSPEEQYAARYSTSSSAPIVRLTPEEARFAGSCVGRIRNGPFGARSMTEFFGGLTWEMRDLEI